MVTRECGPASSDARLPVPGCRTRELGGGARATICACASDLCNMVTAGVRVVTSPLMMVMMTAALLSHT